MLNYNEKITPRMLDNHIAAILDLDGTIADNQHRLPYINGVEKDWKSYNEKAAQDTFYQHVFNMYCYIAGRYPTIRRVMFTGRMESQRHLTMTWLAKYNIDIDELYMRSNDDLCTNAELKQKMLNRLKAEGVKPYFAFDNDVKTCQMFKEAGVYVYLCNDSKIAPYSPKNS